MKMYKYECEFGFCDDADAFGPCNHEFWASDANLRLCPKCEGYTLEIIATADFIEKDSEK